jgi:hypothetical protein
MVFHVKTYNQFFFLNKNNISVIFIQLHEKNKRIINFKNNKNIDNKKYFFIPVKYSSSVKKNIVSFSFI